MSTRIKVCGLRDPADADAAARAGADAVGFVFVPGTPRAIEPADAFAIMGTLPPFVASVGVFRDVELDDFLDAEEACPTSLVQIHGRASVELVRRCGPGVVRAIHGDADGLARELALWADVEEADAVLIDGSPGGEGARADWPTVARLTRDYPKPVILAGGLDPTNVADAIAAVRPYAVDVSTGVERAPGLKDHDKIRAFCDAVRRADTP